MDDLVAQMGAAFESGTGAFFIGAGISAPSGLPSWNELVKRLAEPLGLTVTDDDDLPLIAQFCVNADAGNPGPLIGRLRDLVTKPTAPNPYHPHIARTNVDLIWTTNYDQLLESVLAGLQVAIRRCDSDLTGGRRSFDVELVKMHGCVDVSRADEFVITRANYEDYAFERPATIERLRQDLLRRNFLFLGYGYRDPNVVTVVAEARRLAKNATREHFMLVREEQGPQNRRQELWAQDLARSGIRAVSYGTYDELTTALRRISLASRGRTVFITGSHTADDARASEIGRLLAHQNVVLLDGQSQGIGRAVLDAYGRACLDARHDLRERTRYFTNPYSFDPSLSNDPSHLETLRSLRRTLLRAARTVVVFDGGMGTRAEIDVAREMGCRIIPVPGDTPTDILSTLAKDASTIEAFSSDYCRALQGKPSAREVVDAVIATLNP